MKSGVPRGPRRARTVEATVLRPARGLAFAALVALPLTSGGVFADDPPPAAPNAQAGATAEALFEEGRALMKAKKYPEACAKLSASLKVDPAIGTMLYLADCYEKNGQTASAWSLFSDAASAAQQANQGERSLKAKLRVQNLLPKLVKLSVTLAPENGDLAGLELKRDGVVVGAVLLGTAVPVDPGNHTIEVTAQGKKPWSGVATVSSSPGTVVAFVVPKLEDLPPPPPPPEPTATATATATVTAPPPPPPPTAPATVTATVVVPPPPPPPDTTIRTVGFFVGGAGLAGAVVASALGIAAKSKKDDSDALCKGAFCTSQTAVDLNNEAKALALGSTAVFVVAGALVATGAGMIIYPSVSGPPAPKTARPKPTLGVGLGIGSLAVHGRF